MNGKDIKVKELLAKIGLELKEIHRDEIYLNLGNGEIDSIEIGEVEYVDANFNRPHIYVYQGEHKGEHFEYEDLIERLRKQYNDNSINKIEDTKGFRYCDNRYMYVCNDKNDIYIIKKTIATETKWYIGMEHTFDTLDELEEYILENYKTK